MDISRVKWQEFVSGNDDSYCWIYTTYAQKLYQYGMCFTTDTELVKDCIQDIFTYLYRNKAQLVSPDNIKVYLFTALKNNLIKQIHKETITENLVEDVPFVLELTVEEQFIQDEQYKNERKQVEKILSLLTSRQKEIIYYRFIQEMSMEDICTLMFLYFHSALNLIERSLKKIRSSMGDINLLIFFLFAMGLNIFL